MGKITVNKNVFWDAGGKKMSGKVKQILSDHAIVKAEGCEYVVRKASLSTIPLTHVASIVVAAGDAPLHKTKGAPTALEITYDPNNPMPFNFKWVDAVGVVGCSNHPTIKKVDGIINGAALEKKQEWNPEIFGKPAAETPIAETTTTPETVAPEAAPAKPVTEAPVVQPPQRQRQGPGMA